MMGGHGEDGLRDLTEYRVRLVNGAHGLGYGAGGGGGGGGGMGHC